MMPGPARLKKNKAVTRHDLREALGEVLAGKTVSQPVTTAVGCPIVLEEARLITTKLTYYKDVLPILQNRCQVCHRPGETGPFSLMTYAQAVNWAADIKEYTQSRAMPPWKPTDGVPLRGERKLTDEEIATLAAWADGGTPQGRASRRAAARQVRRRLDAGPARSDPDAEGRIHARARPAAIITASTSSRSTWPRTSSSPATRFVRAIRGPCITRSISST